VKNRNLVGVQAFLACDAHGRAEPVVVTIFDPCVTASNPVGTDEIEALEKVISVTGYAGLVSFMIEAVYLEHMRARAAFVMSEFFRQDGAILLVRCDSEAARRAFVAELKVSFSLQPIAKARRTTQQPASISERSPTSVVPTT
jgi:hypothetical protein